MEEVEGPKQQTMLWQPSEQEEALQCQTTVGSCQTVKWCIIFYCPAGYIQLVNFLHGNCCLIDGVSYLALDLCAAAYLLYFALSLSDSVEEGDKVVKTAIDKFGRLGECRHVM